MEMVEDEGRGGWLIGRTTVKLIESREKLNKGVNPTMRVKYSVCVVEGIRLQSLCVESVEYPSV